MSDAVQLDTTSLDQALAYARRGWRVIPIPPGQKFPRGVTVWQVDGTTDEAKIRHWWTNAPDHGIGIVTGAESGLWVLDVDVAGDKIGDETLADLCDAYGPLPDTHEVITGSGGRHLYFAWPTNGQIVTNSASGRLGPGLDVRGEGGFVVAPPSLHANGQRYELEASSPDHTAPAPGWLLALLEQPAPAPAQRTTSQPAGDRPGDLWAATVTWAEILTTDGWTLHHTDREGEEHWTRPGKDRRDGTSATTGYKGSDILKVFTSSHPHLHADETYTKLGYLAATKHQGDHRAAARALAADGWRSDPIADLIGRPQPPTAGDPSDPAVIEAAAEVEEHARADWAPIDLATILAEGHEPPSPTILAVAGGPPLFYPGRTNAIFGESGGGKTWVALAAIRDELAAGNTTIFIDLEDSPHGILSRLVSLGVTHEAITTRFVYLAPQTGWGPPAQATFAGLLEEHRPTLVVLDSTGEAMAAQGVKGNDDDDVARWFWAFPRWIARRDPAVIVIDHLPKDSSGSPTHQIGSQRKKAAIDGASYRVDITTPPSRTTDGVLKLIVAKDRNGTRALNETAALVHLAHDLLGHVTLTLTASDSPSLDHRGNPRRTIYMERISRWLEDHPGSSSGDIEKAVEGKATILREALATLHDEGHIERESYARKHSWMIVRPYRQEDDPRVSHAIPQTAPHDVSMDVADGSSAYSSHSSPTRPTPRDEPPKTYSSHTPSPYGGGTNFVPPPKPTKSAPPAPNSSPETDDLTADESLFLDDDPPELA